MKVAIDWNTTDSMFLLKLQLKCFIFVDRLKSPV